MGLAALIVATTVARAAAAPAVAVSPPTLDVGEVWATPGNMQPLRFDVQSTGTSAVTVTDLRIVGADAAQLAFDPAADPACGATQHCAVAFTLAPGGARQFGLVCAPSAAGYLTADLVVTSDAAAGPLTVPITCTADGPPAVAVAPASLAFPVVRAEKEGATLTLAITNTATPPAAPFDFTITGPPWLDPTAFLVSGPCGATCEVLPGETVSYTILFRPHDASPYDGDIVLTNQVGGGWGPSTIAIPMHAQGAYPAFVFDDPASGVLALAPVPVGQPATGAITGHNAGPVAGFVWAVYGDGDVLVTGGPTSQLTLGPGEGATWDVTCTPQTIGGGSGRVAFDTDVGTTYALVSCPATGASLVATPPYLAFGEVGLGGAAATVTVANQGDVAAELIAITSDDPRFTAAPASGALPVTIAPGAAVDVRVTFAPTDHTSAAAWISFATQQGGAADTRMRVAGDAATTTPAAADLGAIGYADGATRTLAIGNAGAAPVTVSAVSLDAPEFALAGLAAGDVIPAGGARAFDVIATPTRLGHRHATAWIGYGGLAAAPIALDALATDPALTVTASAGFPGEYRLAFGDVDVDTGAAAGHVTLAAAAPFTITSCTVSGAAAFAITACPAAIAAGGTADVAVAFDPDAEARFDGTLTVRGDFGTGALDVALGGVGVEQHVALSALVLDFPPTARHPTTPATRTVTITNTGAAALALTSIAVTGDGFTAPGAPHLTLAPGQAGDVTVAFAPPAAGDFTGALVLGDDLDPAIARVALTGRGVDRAVEVTPTTIELGDVAVGTTARLSERGGAIAVRDLDAAASYTIARATLAGGAAWQLLGPDHDVIAPGGPAATLDVAFTPTAAGDATAELAIYLDADPDPHARVAIHAHAIAAPPLPVTEAPGGCCDSGGRAGGAPLAPLALVAAALARRAARRRRRAR